MFRGQHGGTGLGLELGGDLLGEIDDAVGIAPLVVVPGNEFEELAVEFDRGTGVVDRGALVVGEVGRDHFFVGVAENAREVGLRGFLEGSADLLEGGFLGGLEGQIDDGHGWGRYAEGHARELAFDFGAHEGDSLGGAGGGGDDVLRGGAATLPVFLGWAVHGLLRGGVSVNGGEQTFLETEAFFEEHVDERREAVRGAGGVGNDAVFGDVEFVVVHAHHDGDVFALRGSGNDDLLSASGDVALGFFGFGEEAGRFDHEIDAQLGPRKFGGGLGGDHEDVLAVNHEDVVFGLVWGGFFGGNGALEFTLGRVVFNKVREIVSGDDIADGDHIEGGAKQALLNESAENETTDTTKTIDCDFYCHGRLRIFKCCLLEWDWVITRERREG